MAVFESLNSISSKIEDFHNSMKEKESLKQSRQFLVKELEEFIGRAEEIQKMLAVIDASAKAEGKDISVEKQELEFENLSVFLKRNMQFEKEKLSRTSAFDQITENSEIPEIYNAIEEKAKKALLGLNYFVEKNTVALQTEKLQFSGSKQGQNVLALLKTKDLELEELKKKYGSLMAKGLLARLEEETSADFEETLNQTARNLEVSSSEVQKISIENRGIVEKIQKNQSVLEQKIRENDELLSKFMSKGLETITVLKKERDAAKKFALDLEHETTTLRQTYSKELLGLQEHKMQLQKQLQDEFVKKNKGIELELRQKSEYLEHFKKLVDEKESELRSLKEKFEHHKAILQHYTVHDKIKKRQAGHSRKTGK
ncbi:MAG: hypothetical protein Q7R70_02825 [Candidatus Diapherotrites archaeon]|nr:hypothetical protein [Candidatus Diapherotrites archaeon]